MGGIWAVLYVLGLAMSGLVFLGSSVIVVIWAKRLQRLGARPRPLWQYFALHLVLGFGLAIPFGPFAIVAWMVLPAYLIASHRQAVKSTASGQEASIAARSTSAARRSWGLAVLFTVTGTLLPWVVGFGVKIYLDSLGRPTLPLGGFLDPGSVAIEIVLTLGAWAFPFLILASAVVVPWRVGFTSDSPARLSMLPIWLAYGAAVVATIPVFVAVFLEFDSMMLLVPVGLILIPPMALGYFAGWWLLRRRKLAPRGA